MENELSKRNPVPGTSLTLSDRGVLIAKKIVDINLIVGFPLSKEDVITWSAEIDRLVDPDDLKKLPFILDCFKTCKLEYDNNLGIRNIFLAMKQVGEDEEGNFKLRRFH